jgi:small subunit ribosomal protein S19e
MPKVTEVPAQELVSKASKRMQKMEEFKPPVWSAYVKTGVSRQRPPQQEDWWYIRSASILRKVYVNQTLGVSKLRKVYGGRKNRGHKPEHKYKASGSIIRKVLQQLEAAGFVKTEKGKGRKITKKGSDFLKEVASSKQ